MTLRVALVTGASERGGAERALLSLARALPGAGVEPVVLALAGGPFPDEVERAGIPLERLPATAAARARAVWKVPQVSRAVAAAARRHGAAVVQASGEKVALYAAWAARRAGVPSVAWLHDAPARDAASTALQLAVAASRPNATVVPSAWMARRFARFGLRPVHVPLGIELDPEPRPVDGLAASLGWPADSVVVAHAGRLQRWKGADVFLRAAAQVAARHPAARFLVVGGALYGWEEEFASSLPALAASLGLAGRVHFTGHRDDALDLLATAEVAVHSSRRPEPFGLVVAEAMALGRAVVASRTGGPEEQVHDGVTGLLVPPGDEIALAGALDRLLGDAGLRAALGAAARDHARRTWDPAATAARFAGLYRDLTGERVRT